MLELKEKTEALQTQNDYLATRRPEIAPHFTWMLVGVRVCENCHLGFSLLSFDMPLADVMRGPPLTLLIIRRAFQGLPFAGVSDALGSLLTSRFELVRLEIPKQASAFVAGALGAELSLSSPQVPLDS